MTPGSSPDARAAPCKLISVIIPVYNERHNIERAYDSVTRVFSSLRDRYEYEILFTDNHSTDGSFEVLHSIASRDDRVRVIRFTRNFGFQRSVLTGYRYARGAAAVQIDCDLQDPPEQIPVFLTEWESGADVVVGIREQREEGGVMTAFRRLFYRLLNAISDDRLPPDAGDFRLVDHTILEQLRVIDDYAPYVRGLISTLARSETGIRYKRARREFDESKFGFLRLLSFAADGILAHSILPLRVAIYAGLVTTILTAALILFYLARMLFFGASWPAGIPTVTILILFGLSLNGIFLGIIGEYVGRIYLQVRRRPTVVIERTLNLTPDSWWGRHHERSRGGA